MSRGSERQQPFRWAIVVLCVTKMDISAALKKASRIEPKIWRKKNNVESKFRLLRIQLELWFDSLNIDFIDLPVLVLLGLATTGS